MNTHQKVIDAGETILRSSERLLHLRFIDGVTQELLNCSAIVLYRQQAGERRAPLVGFIGCTGTGKSTLFNSLIADEISSIGWQAHNTLGPVLYADHVFFQSLERIEKSLGNLILPGFERFVIHNFTEESRQEICGDSKKAVLVKSTKKTEAVYIDLPDINTSRARDEQEVSLRLQPWFDTVIFMADDETIFHRDYQIPVRQACRLGQNRVCVLVGRGNDRIDLSHPDMQGVKDFFQVYRIHVLPDLQDKKYYTDEPGFLELKRFVENARTRQDPAPLLKIMAENAKQLMLKNEQRVERLKKLDHEISSTLEKCASDKSTIPLEKILHDDVLHVLHHLGLKRFALTNILKFFKTIVTTGGIKKSFQVSFGSQRESLVDRFLHFDRVKLRTEVENRLADYGETVAKNVRAYLQANDEINRIPDLKNVLARLSDVKEIFSSGELESGLDESLKRFEDECKRLMLSDTLKHVMKNDPLVVLSTLVMLVVDTIAIPGMGSFLLVPSIFKILPMGAFETAKKNFQQGIRDAVRKQLFTINEQYLNVRQSFVLDKNEPLYHALEACAEFGEHK